MLSSLGLYSLVPGSDELVLGSPEVSRARLRVPERPVLDIHAHHQAPEAVYVSRASLNGQRLEHTVRFSTLAKGRAKLLEFFMSKAPSRLRGKMVPLQAVLRLQLCVLRSGAAGAARERSMSSSC